MTLEQNKLLKLVLPGVYLGVVLFIDSYADVGTVTPFCAVFGLLYMSVNYPPRLMIPWCCIYILTICSIFLVPSFYVFFTHHPYNQQYVNPCIRSATYVGVGILASYLCVILNRFWKSEEEMKAILGNLPWPIITSDHNGKLIYSNTRAKQLMPELVEKGIVRSYFDLLAPPQFPGRTIAEYMKRIDHGFHEKPLQLELHGVPYLGFTQMMESTGKKLVLTILVKPNSPESFPTP